MLDRETQYTAMMMIAKLVELNAHKLYIAATGAGAGLQDIIWANSGISKILIGSVFPYSQPDFNRFIGTELKGSYVSLEGALALANAGYCYAQEIAAIQGELDKEIISLGLSAAVVTSRELRGGTRVHLALRTRKTTLTASVTMSQSLLTRKEQGEICDLLGLNMILQATGIPEIILPTFPHTSDEIIEDEGYLYLRPTLVRPGSIDVALPVFIHANGDITPFNNDMLNPDLHVVYPGSFKEYHYGHDNIARAIKALGKEPVLEITSTNADKIQIEDSELAWRALQFSGRWPAILRNDCSLFIDKARAYSGCSFVVGVDTAERLLDSKYYPNGIDSLDQVLMEFKQMSTKFYVISREKDGILKTCEDLNILAHYEKLFIPLPGRWDISSTQIRQATTT